MPADSLDTEKTRDGTSMAFENAIKYAHSKMAAQGFALLEQHFDGRTGLDELAEYVIRWARAAYRDPDIPSLSAQIQVIDNDLHDVPQPYAVHAAFVRECWLSSTLRGDSLDTVALHRKATQHRLDWLERIQDRIEREIFVLRSILNYLDSSMTAPLKHLPRKGLSHALEGATSPRGEDSLREFVVGLRRDLGLSRKAIYDLARALRLTNEGMTRGAFNDNYKRWKPDSAKSKMELPSQILNLAEQGGEHCEKPEKPTAAEREALLAEEKEKVQQPRDRRMVIRFEPIGLREFVYPPPPHPPDKPIEDEFDPEVHRMCDRVAQKA